ncbi:hypothetical protein EDC96DRAFT_576932 [Choanephora cucurbitarum]|nr:hypothetical protein EDC96DRAFT_576932 [Choanephora cucurbitarum]
MRQREDRLFAQALNKLANALITDNDVALMNSRWVTEIGPDIKQKRPILLFYRNIDANNLKDQALAESPGRMHISEVSDAVSGGDPRTDQTSLEAARNMKIADAMAGPASYGVCQAGCNAVAVACYAAAGFTFGTVTAGAGIPASIAACNTALGTCMAKCVLAGLCPIP